MTAGIQHSRQPKLLAAGAFEGEIRSFRLQLAAEGKLPKTIRMYTEAVQWFAAAHLLRETGRTGWEQVCGQDVQRWMAWLLSRYSSSCQQPVPGPAAVLCPPAALKIAHQLVTERGVPSLRRRAEPIWAAGRRQQAVGPRLPRRAVCPRRG